LRDRTADFVAAAFTVGASAVMLKPWQLFTSAQ